MGIGAVGDTSGSAAYRALSARNAEAGAAASEARGSVPERETDAVEISRDAAAVRDTVGALAKQAARSQQPRPEVVEAARARLAAGHADDPAVVRATVQRMLGGGA
ncbi:MAG: hypothetical protein D6776_09370 [Planctomycetota bacterium]|nr:MAG: hypothetical protein D6776_09370 [Planctomycetota bacterium]